VLNLSGSYRHSEYDTGIATDTYGVGFNAAPSRRMRLRGSYQHAVRAPDVRELFNPHFPSGYALDAGDPCAGESPARSLSDCQRTGVTPSQYGHVFDNPFPDGGYPATGGGNPELKPESAKTYTAGVVLTPTRDLSSTIDYFDIRIEDTIASFGGDVIFNQCIDTGEPAFCRLITRDPQSGALWYGAANVNAINQNIGTARVIGTDVAVNYRLRWPRGHIILFDGMGSYLSKFSVQAYPHGPFQDCAGQFSSACNDMPLPRWRHRLRIAWQPPADYEVAATWRYIGSTTVAPPVPDLPVTVSQPPMNYLDLAGAWNVTKRVTLRAGVNNVTDRDPPLVIGSPPGVNGNAYAQAYDVLGRHFFLRLTAKF
jgi:outer membrane receptor protein involved in Fe transport